MRLLIAVINFRTPQLTIEALVSIENQIAEVDAQVVLVDNASGDDSLPRLTEARDVDWVGGAFMMIRRDVIERVGPLDEGFFFYGEDAEFSHRVRRAGWRVRYDPGAAIIHLGGASSDPARLATRQRSAFQWQ